MRDTSNICVAVRLRPFNERERTRDAKLVVVVDPARPNVCTLTHPSDSSQSRNFTFDHVFDSFTDDLEHVATQRKVWEAIGLPVLDAAWQGYNVSLFVSGAGLRR